MATGELGGNKTQVTLSLHPEQDRLLGVAAAAEGIPKEGIYRTALAQYFVRRATEDEGFAREVRASARAIWTEQVAMLRQALGPVTVVAEDKIIFPEWMREPEGQG